MRAHKLTLQALWQILLPTFLVFAAESNKECHDEVSGMVADDILELILQLITYLKKKQFDSLLKDFIASQSEDINFVFWWNNIDMQFT